jgi:hypothetical protein
MVTDLAKQEKLPSPEPIEFERQTVSPITSPAASPELAGLPDLNLVDSFLSISMTH